MGVGERLRSARDARGLSLAEVSVRTKIQPWVLDALESDHLQEQMSPVYAKGFLGTYARFLSLSAEALFAELEWTKPAPQVDEEPFTPTDLRPPLMRRIPWRRVRAAAGLAAGCAVAAAAVAVNPLRWLPRVSWPQDERPAMASLTPVPAMAPESVPAPSASPVRRDEGLMRLSLNARRTTWVQVWADGKLLLQGRLNRGEQEAWTGRREFTLVVAKPTHVDVALDEATITDAVIRHGGRLAITREGIRALSESP